MPNRADEITDEHDPRPAQSPLLAQGRGGEAMIFGEYPCCSAFLSLSVPERTPAYMRDECPECGTACWHRISRVDPTSWTEEEFLKTHKVDMEKKSIEEIK